MNKGINLQNIYILDLKKEKILGGMNRGITFQKI